jgi:hypothetical protein
VSLAARYPKNETGGLPAAIPPSKEFAMSTSTITQHYLPDRLTGLLEDIWREIPNAREAEYEALIGVSEWILDRLLGRPVLYGQNQAIESISDLLDLLEDWLPLDGDAEEEEAVVQP